MAVRLLAGYGLWAAVLFTSAGRPGWREGWLTLAVSLALVVLNAPLLAVKNPEILRERWKRRTDTKRFDKVLGAIGLPAWLAIPLVAGLGVRYGWAVLPEPSLWAGLALIALGNVPILGSMLVNRHLETTVRVQHDRGHEVVSAGPYRFVRHPMYLGIVAQLAGTVLALGVTAGFAPFAVVTLVLVIRTAMEDRTLKEELPGYPEYAAKTRYRLVPWIW